MHLYEHDQDKVSAYLNEGFQSPTFAMPKMPSGCQFDNLITFLDIEQLIRSGTITAAAQIKLPEYWRDLALVLLRLADSRFKRGQKILEDNFSNISNNFYKNFFIKRPKILSKAPKSVIIQDNLNLGDDDADKN